MLSVIAQQIHAILTALSLKQKRFVFEGKEIPLLPQVAIFITMNPGTILLKGIDDYRIGLVLFRLCWSYGITRQSQITVPTSVNGGT